MNITAQGKTANIYDLGDIFVIYIHPFVLIKVKPTAMTDLNGMKSIFSEINRISQGRKDCKLLIDATDGGDLSIQAKIFLFSDHPLIERFERMGLVLTSVLANIFSSLLKEGRGRKKKILNDQSAALSWLSTECTEPQKNLLAEMAQEFYLKIKLTQHHIQAVDLEQIFIEKNFPKILYSVAVLAAIITMVFYYLGDNSTLYAGIAFISSSFLLYIARNTLTKFYLFNGYLCSWLLTNIYLVHTTGGILGPFGIAYFPLPLVAFILLPIQQGLFWSGLILLINAGNLSPYFISLWGDEPKQFPDLGTLSVYYSILLLCIILGGILKVFLSRKQSREYEYKNISVHKSHEIGSVLHHFKQLDFSQQCPVDGESSVFDQISSDINHMGNRLRATLSDKERVLKELEIILDNIPSGLAVIDTSSKIVRHSKFFFTIFGSSPSKDFIETIYQNRGDELQEAKMSREVLKTILGDSEMNFEMNKANLPQNMVVKGRYLRFLWTNLLNPESNETDLLIVSVDDISNEIEKEKVTLTKNQEVEVIFRSLSDLLGVKRYLKNCQALVNLCLDLIDNSSPRREVLNITHTIKGDSRSTGAFYIAELMHKIEIMIQSNSKNGDFDRKECRILMQEAGSSLESLAHVLSRISGLNPQKGTKGYSQVFFDAIRNDPQCAKLLSNSELEIQCSTSIDFLSEISQIVLASIFGHFIRNTLAHGYDLTRTSTHKIYSCAKIVNKKIMIEYWDGGRGIDLSSLREKSNHHQTSSDLEVANTVFENDVSTAQTVDEISGIGAGLAAVKQLVESVGGKVELKLDPAEGNRYRKFRYLISIPT